MHIGTYHYDRTGDLQRDRMTYTCDYCSFTYHRDGIQWGSKEGPQERVLRHMIEDHPDLIKMALAFDDNLITRTTDDVDGWIEDSYFSTGHIKYYKRNQRLGGRYLGEYAL